MKLGGLVLSVGHVGADRRRASEEERTRYRQEHGMGSANDSNGGRNGNGRVSAFKTATMWTALLVFMGFLFNHWTAGLEKRDDIQDEALRLLSEKVPPKEWVQGVNAHIQRSETIADEFRAVQTAVRVVETHQTAILARLERQEQLLLQVLRGLPAGREERADAAPAGPRPPSPAPGSAPVATASPGGP